METQKNFDSSRHQRQPTQHVKYNICHLVNVARSKTELLRGNLTTPHLCTEELRVTRLINCPSNGRFCNTECCQTEYYFLCYVSGLIHQPPGQHSIEHSPLGKPSPVALVFNYQSKFNMSPFDLIHPAHSSKTPSPILELGIEQQIKQISDLLELSFQLQSHRRIAY